MRAELILPQSRFWFGFAAGCEARLCLAVLKKRNWAMPWSIVRRGRWLILAQWMERSDNSGVTYHYTRTNPEKVSPAFGVSQR